MPNGWVAFFTALHVVTIVMLVIYFTGHHFVDPEAYRLAKSEHSIDALKVAYNTGRLELVALSLTVLGVAVGVFAVLGFWVYGHVVERAAIKETREIAPQEIARIMKDDPGLWLRVIRANPETFRSAISEAFAETDALKDALSSVQGNAISENAGDGEHE